MFQNQPVTQIPRHQRRAFFLGLILAAVTLAIYWPVRHYHFVDYDDNSYVSENPDISGGWSWWGLTWAFVDQHAGNWHPITWISHMTDCQFFGLNAGPMHLENAVIHCINAVLLLLLLNSMTRAFWRSAFVAALFALHPLRVESVAWISERKDVLSGFFFMLTLWFYVLYAKKIDGDHSPDTAAEQKISRGNIFYRLSVASFALGILSKSMLVTVPIILLVLDFWPLKRIKNSGPKISGSKVLCRNNDVAEIAPSTVLRTPSPPLGEKAGMRGRLIPTIQLVTEKWPFFLLAFVVGVITLISQRVGGGWVHSHETVFVRLENIFVNYLSYIEKLLWPQNLSFLYLRHDKIPSGEFFLAAMVLLAISVAVAIFSRRSRAPAAGWLWFLIMLLPVSGIFSLARLSIADRYTYLPSIGFYWMVTWTVADLTEAISFSWLKKVLKIVNAVGAAVILIYCALLTHRQIPVWQNTQTLMEHALKMDPANYVAKQNLHIYLFEKAHPGVRDDDANSPAKNSAR